MNRTELIWNIVDFFKETHNIPKADLGFKSPLILFKDGDDILQIEKYYQFDVTICEYKGNIAISVHQQEYHDLPISVLELIYERIEILKLF